MPQLPDQLELKQEPLDVFVVQCGGEYLLARALRAEVRSHEHVPEGSPSDDLSISLFVSFKLHVIARDEQGGVDVVGAGIGDCD